MIKGPREKCLISFRQHLGDLFFFFPTCPVAFYFMINLMLEMNLSSTFTKALCVEIESISLVSFKPVVGKEWSDFKKKVYDSLRVLFPFSTNLASCH